MLHHKLNLIYRIKRKYWDKKGHHVHSPFFFHLVTNVVGNDHQYYVFDQLMSTFKIKNSDDKKVAKCLFSTIQFLKPDVIYLYEPEYCIRSFIAMTFSQIPIIILQEETNAISTSQDLKSETDLKKQFYTDQRNKVIYFGGKPSKKLVYNLMTYSLDSPHDDTHKIKIFKTAFYRIRRRGQQYKDWSDIKRNLSQKCSIVDTLQLGIILSHSGNMNNQKANIYKGYLK